MRQFQNVRLIINVIFFSLIISASIGQTISRSGDGLESGQHAGDGSSQLPDYKTEMVKLYKAIRDNYFDSSSGYYREFPKTQEQKNKASYLWPICAIFQAENEIEAVQKQRNLIPATVSIINKYYDKRPPAPGYASYPPELGGGDRFYDDNQWIGITFLDAFERLKNKTYLDKGKEIYQFMMTAYDSTAGGGLYWEEGKPTKNTCSNGPGIILALQLYKATKEKRYLDTALLLYEWVNKKLYDGAGLYYDNINTKSGKIDQKKYSYNTGTMLQSNLYLLELTGDKKYLSTAIEIADAATVYFYGTGKFRDNLWFNAVMLRAFIHLRKHHPDNKYLLAFKTCTDQTIRENKNQNGLIGIGKVNDIVSQGGMLEILAKFSALKL
ncbi:MAG: glycoside hydrolase family 76 [Chitinophagaceae bacterium]|nr:MAG: glycoside hydrolase family 76 [Chitinophagaceae bacterium]